MAYYAIEASRNKATEFSRWTAKVAAPAAAGSGVVIQLVGLGNVVLPDGRSFFPFATNAPVTIGLGANAETVTPSAVSVANGTITVTISNAHGQNDPVVSGSFGLQEAINASVVSGGIAQVGTGFGGSTSTITSASFAGAGAGAVVEDCRSGIPVFYDGSANQPYGPTAAKPQVASVLLSSAQLLAIQTTAITLVAAPGAGKMLIPLKLVLSYKFNTTAYTIANADNAFRLQYVGQTTSLASTLATGLVSAATSTTGYVNMVSPQTGIANTVAANLGLELKLAIGTTPALTLGDGTVQAYVEYEIVTLP